MTTDGRSSDKLHVLVVDDNKTLCWTLARVLEAEGCRATSVLTASAAREAIASGDVDVVLCDRTLGQGDDDGFSVLAYAREASPSSLRVLVSGHLPDASDDLTDVNLSMMKPLVSEDLRELVQWAGQRRAGTD